MTLNTGEQDLSLFLPQKRRRGKLARITAIGVVATMGISLAAGPSWAGESAPTTPQTVPEKTAPEKNGPPSQGGIPVVDETVEAAKSRAVKTGKRVEISEHNSETTTLYANPDGKTLRMELHTEPLRVKNAKGDGFVPVDTTLVKKDGVIKPKAIKGDLTLSAGDDSFVLKSKGVKGTAEIAPPDKLPKPKLRGSAATYASVYGDSVDLVVTATSTGFRQEIVLRERIAGPVSFRMPTTLPSGMSFGEDISGRATLLGENGRKVADLPPAMLLDAEANDPKADIDEGKVGKASVSVDPITSTLVYEQGPGVSRI